MKLSIKILLFVLCTIFLVSYGIFYATLQGDGDGDGDLIVSELSISFVNTTDLSFGDLVGSVENALGDLSASSNIVVVVITTGTYDGIGSSAHDVLGGALNLLCPTSLYGLVCEMLFIDGASGTPIIHPSLRRLSDVVQFQLSSTIPDDIFDDFIVVPSIADLDVVHGGITYTLGILDQNVTIDVVSSVPVSGLGEVVALFESIDEDASTVLGIPSGNIGLIDILHHTDAPATSPTVLPTYSPTVGGNFILYGGTECLGASGLVPDYWSFGSITLLECQDICRGGSGCLGVEMIVGDECLVHVSDSSDSSEFWTSNNGTMTDSGTVEELSLTHMDANEGLSGSDCYVLSYTDRPSAVATAAPSVTPSAAPSVTPSAAPSVTPSAAPTTVSPTTVPTVSPTLSPTTVPTVSPTLSPTTVPTVSPTTVSPTTVPTVSPTTVSPTTVPTSVPTSMTPTSAPTSAFCHDVNTHLVNKFSGDELGTSISYSRSTHDEIYPICRDDCLSRPTVCLGFQIIFDEGYVCRVFDLQSGETVDHHVTNSEDFFYNDQCASDDDNNMYVRIDLFQYSVLNSNPCNCS